MQPTTAQGKYLRAIQSLTLDGAGTTVTRMALFMGVTKASVSVAVSGLCAAGMARKHNRKWIALTEEGRRLALLSCGKREILQRFFSDVLGVPEDTAEADAEAVETVISVASLCALCGRARRNACADCRLPGGPAGEAGHASPQ